jgi:hypothetical protein
MSLSSDGDKMKHNHTPAMPTGAPRQGREVTDRLSRPTKDTPLRDGSEREESHRKRHGKAVPNAENVHAQVATCAGLDGAACLQLESTGMTGTIDLAHAARTEGDLVWAGAGAEGERHGKWNYRECGDSEALVMHLRTGIAQP